MDTGKNTGTRMHAANRYTARVTNPEHFPGSKFCVPAMGPGWTSNQNRYTLHVRHSALGTANNRLEAVSEVAFCRSLSFEDIAVYRMGNQSRAHLGEAQP